MKPPTPMVPWWNRLALALVAIAAFHVAMTRPWLAPLMLFFAWGLCQVSLAGSSRVAFWTGLTIGLACYAPHLRFFWTIFGPAAIALWLVLSFWTGLFALLVNHAHRKIGTSVRWLIPFAWLALEYFRSELYYLRFSWLTPGLAFPPGLILTLAGSGGIGFLLFAMATATLLRAARPQALALAGGMLLLWVASLVPTPPPAGVAQLKIAGLQAEFPDARRIPFLLDKVLRNFPNADLLVLRACLKTRDC